MFAVPTRRVVWWCEWTGELGDLNHHTTSCLKRPWKCHYCDFESTHDIGTNDHTPCCDNYPLPCPNQCEIGTVPRCQADSHLLECPLQLVECEFAGAGCDAKRSGGSHDGECPTSPPDSHPPQPATNERATPENGGERPANSRLAETSEGTRQ